MQHNNVFFSSADVDRYREKLKTDPAARARYEKYTQTVEKDLSEPYASWEEANDSDTQGRNFGVLHSQADRLSVSLGLKYLVEGDLRCAERLKGLLAHFIAFPRWYGVSYSTRKPVPWHSDLYSTAATLSFGRIYDLIFDTLTPAERGDLAQGILGKGVLPAFSDWVLPQKRIHALDSMGHNWWAACIGEAATALLAIKDHLPAGQGDELPRVRGPRACGVSDVSGQPAVQQIPELR